MELVTFVLGLLAGWAIQHLYARQSSKEVLTITRAFAEVAEARGLVVWTRDKDGKITFGRIHAGHVEGTLEDWVATIQGRSATPPVATADARPPASVPD